MKDTYIQKDYEALCFPPKPASGARFTWSCTISGVTIYFVERTSMTSWENVPSRELERLVLSAIGREATPAVCEYFFPGGRPTLELMDKVHQVVDPPGGGEGGKLVRV